jgi:ribosomal protein S18
MISHSRKEDIRTAFKKVRPHKKVCYFKKNNPHIDYKDVELLKKFTTPTGKICLPSFNWYTREISTKNRYRYQECKINGVITIYQRLINMCYCGTKPIFFNEVKYTLLARQLVDAYDIAWIKTKTNVN